MNIGVNDGHTINGFGTGAVGRIVEGVQTRIVGAEVRRLLKEAGHNAINCTVDYANSVIESLSKIMDQANRQDLDWFIAIHFNAGGGEGVEAYTYEGRQYQDAIDVCKNITNLGFKNRGVKDGKGLYVIRKTTAKSILIEVCFVDTDDANHYLQLGYKSIAKAIVEALIGVIKATPIIIPPVAAPVKVSEIAYRVRKTWADAASQKGAFNNLDNAKDCVTVNVGYKVYDNSGVQVYPVISVNKYGIVTASVLNVRSGAGTNYEIVGTLKKGEKVRIGNKQGGFYNIYFGDHGGFVSADYLTLV